jgi:hypothetical protein
MAPMKISYAVPNSSFADSFSETESPWIVLLDRRSVPTQAVQRWNIDKPRR